VSYKPSEANLTQERYKHTVLS